MLALGIVLATIPVQGPAWADAPDSSIRPAARPVALLTAPAAAQAARPTEAATAVLRPRPRPAGLLLPSPTPQAAAPEPVLAEPTATQTAATNSTARSLRPKPRPDALTNLTLAAAPTPEPQPEPQQSRKKQEKLSNKGSVCGDPAIKGEALAPIKGKVKGCGLDKPVRVTSISGIRLNQAATFSCDTAKAMKSWIENGLRPAMGRREVVEIRVAASYVCRNRNNKKGAKI
ncbi:MAG: extensin family protein, partial [Paracoccaceae bacterium]